MKTRFSIILICTLALVIVASMALAVPPTINYQGRLADSGGTPVNATVNMTFAIYNTPSGGASLWNEYHPGVMVTDGAFSVTLGSESTPITLPFDEQYYLGVQVEADAEMAPRAVLVSVPYAMRAAEVDTIAAGSVTSAEIADGAVSTAKISVPLDLIGADSSPIIRSTNTGTGKAGEFKVDNVSSSAHAISATTNGNGYAVYGSSSGTGYAVYGLNTGTGVAGTFLINNPVNINHAVYAQTTGPGNAVYGLTTGAGRAGYFWINNAGNAQPALEATSNGSGYTIYGHNSGTGKAGLFQITNGSSTAQALFATTSGTGYSGYFSGGSGVYVSGNLNVTGNITGDGSGLTNVDADKLQGVPISPALCGLGNVLKMSAGTSWDCAPDISDPSVPLELSGSPSSAIVNAVNTGTGNAGNFTINNASNPSPALNVTTNGFGPAGYFEIANPGGSTAHALYAITNAEGFAVYGQSTSLDSGGGYFLSTNTNNTGDALYAYTNGKGHAVHGKSMGTGYSGYFEGGQGIRVVGMINATSFKGDGSGLTDVPVEAHNHDSDYVNVTGDSMTGTLSVDSSSGNTIYGRNTGMTGKAGWFVIDNASSTEDAIYGTSNGSAGAAVHGYTTGAGWGGYFSINNPSNVKTALYAETNGSGSAVSGYQTGTGWAGHFTTNNVSNSNPALYVETAGSGNAVYGLNTGTGRAGYFQITNSGNNQYALYASTNGTGYSGYFTGGAGVYVNGNLEATGYTKLALTTGAPPAADCDEVSERGRMKVDNVNGLLYICVNTGWVSK